MDDLVLCFLVLCTFFTFFMVHFWNIASDKARKMGRGEYLLSLNSLIFLGAYVVHKLLLCKRCARLNEKNPPKFSILLDHNDGFLYRLFNAN